MKIILNTSFITLNEYIDAERKNKFMAANMKKFHTEKVQLLAMEQKFKLPEKKHNIKITWYKPNSRSDHDNISFAIKFVLDGLILAKAMKSDSPKYIGNIYHEFEVDKTRNYISCAVEFFDVEKYEFQVIRFDEHFE